MGPYSPSAALSLLVLLAADTVLAEWFCANAGAWDDYCPPSPPATTIPGSSFAGISANCTAYAPPLPRDVDWLAVRRNLTLAVFGSATLPSTLLPDDVLPLPSSRATGCTCSTLGECSPTQCAWSNNLTQLVFTTTVAVNASYSITLNSTVFHTLNTSGVAPVNYPPAGPPQMPGQPGVGPAFPALARGRTLLLFHNGHNQPCDSTGCVPDYDGVVDWANQVGLDVMAFQMPLFQCNYVPAIGCNHAWFTQFSGAHTMRFFIEPVIRAINYATGVLGYDRIVMAGLSGGGWTTTLAAALDPRIALSVPIAGSIPCDFAHTSWDAEQLCDTPWAMVANYTSLYVLAALEAGRASAQVLHEQDPCCFHGCGRHARIRAYNAWVQSQVQGAFATAVTAGNVHEVNPRDKLVLGGLLGAIVARGFVNVSDLAHVPFSLLAAD